MASQNEKSGTGKQGFASMDEDKQREISSQGGKAAHEKGTAHEFSHKEAVEAGHKGGKETQKNYNKNSEQSSSDNNNKASGTKREFDNEKQSSSKGASVNHKSNSDTEDEDSEDSDQREKSGKQGFASMDKEKQKTIATKGGKN